MQSGHPADLFAAAATDWIDYGQTSNATVRPSVHCHELKGATYPTEDELAPLEEGTGELMCTRQSVSNEKMPNSESINRGK